MFDPPRGNMPEAVAIEFNAIRLALGDLYSVWTMYAELFGNKDYGALIEEHATAPFQIVRHALRSDILISFGRLFDRPTTSVKGRSLPNLSFPHLLELLKGNCQDIAVHDNLSSMVEEAEISYKPLDAWRNKRVGHADRSH